MSALLALAGLALLIGGAELLVRGASDLAARLRVPAVLVGLTVVAYGTSAPELAVGIAAGRAGNAAIALGNVLGSNVFNVLVILGISAVLAPLVVQRALIRQDVPVMIGVSVLAAALAADGRVGVADAWVLLGALLLYTAALAAIAVRGARSSARAASEGRAAGEVPPPGGALPVLLSVTRALGGLLLLTFGARWFLEGAVETARLLGVPELIVGLTLVAAGTSLPELVTSLLAAVRGQRDIAVGNVVGSNIFNLLGVLGASALAAPDGIAVPPSVVRFDLPVTLAVAVACLPVFFTGRRISRGEGALFLAFYAAWVAFPFLAASEPDAARRFGAAMRWFVLPLTGVTLAILAARHWRSERAVRDDARPDA